MSEDEHDESAASPEDAPSDRQGTSRPPAGPSDSGDAEPSAKSKNGSDPPSSFRSSPPPKPRSSDSLRPPRPDRSPAPASEPADRARVSVRPARIISVESDAPPRPASQPPPSATSYPQSSPPPPVRLIEDDITEVADEPAELDISIDEEQPASPAPALAQSPDLAQPELPRPPSTGALPDPGRAVSQPPPAPSQRRTRSKPPLPSRPPSVPSSARRVPTTSSPDIEVRALGSPSGLPSAEELTSEIDEVARPAVPADTDEQTEPLADVEDLGAAHELDDAEVAPASDDEPKAGVDEPAEAKPLEALSGGEQSEGIQELSERELASQTDAAAEDDKKKPPPPPPKRRRKPPPAPSERLVQAALEAPTFEAASFRPRVRPWWEEVFDDDFNRAFFPLDEGQVKRESNFIEEALGVAPGGVLLDLACGAGQHAVELSRRGYGVVGYDLSVPQLAIAGENAQQHGQKINFLQGDMREMAFDEMFDGIYCWNTSFGYFEEDKNVAVAQKIFKALRPGGNFLLDVVNRDFVAEQQPSSVWFEGDACVCMDDMSVDFITSRLRVKRTMMLDDGRTKECSYSIRIYSLHELGKMLHDIGFKVTEASGHPSMPGIFLGATSPRVIILAQKP